MLNWVLSRNNINGTSRRHSLFTLTRVFHGSCHGPGIILQPFTSSLKYVVTVVIFIVSSKISFLTPLSLPLINVRLTRKPYLSKPLGSRGTSDALRRRVRLESVCRGWMT